MEYDLISDHRRVASMIAESVLSGLGGFVYDKRLVDDGVVRDVVSSTGISGMLRRWEQDNIVVYYIDVKRLESLCLYSECNEAKVRRVCLNKCVIDKFKEVSSKIINSIREAYSVEV